MNLTAKQKIINNFNQFLQKEIIPNKLEIIMNYELTSEIDFDNLKVIDVYFDSAETSSHSSGYNEYTTIVHEIDLGTQIALLECCVDNSFTGLYPLNNYRITYTSNWGTELEALNKEEFDDFGLHLVLNDYDYLDIILNESLKYDLETEETNRETEKLNQEAKNCFPGLEKIDALSLTECRLYFNTGVDIVVSTSEIKLAIKKFNEQTK